jgi:hypothetical protein
MMVEFLPTHRTVYSDARTRVGAIECGARVVLQFFFLSGHVCFSHLKYPVRVLRALSDHFARFPAGASKDVSKFVFVLGAALAGMTNKYH